MTAPDDIAGLSRNDLLRVIAEQQQQIAALTARVEALQAEVERLRRAVLWRRRSFGTQSAAGSQFVERILTAVTTLRQQHRDVLEYLTAACAAAIGGEQAPSLLPAARPRPAAT